MSVERTWKFENFYNFQKITQYRIQIYILINLLKNWSKFVCNLVLTSRSKDEEIELVTLDDFYKTAPSDISRTVSVIVTYIL